MENEIIEHKRSELQTQKELNPISLIQLAIEKGVDDFTKLKGLYDLQERYEKNLSIKSFNQAFSGFQHECPSIPKNAYKDSRFNSASLDDIATYIKEPLYKNGLSYRFEQKVESDVLYVTCFLQHKDGFSVSTTLSAAKDTSGGKNSIQGLGSTTAYLCRYTLTSVLGLAQCEADNDDDGQSAPDPVRFYDDKKFQNFKAGWIALLLSGSHTVKGVCKLVKGKNGDQPSLSPEQIKELESALVGMNIPKK